MGLFDLDGLADLFGNVASIIIVQGLMLVIVIVAACMVVRIAREFIRPHSSRAVIEVAEWKAKQAGWI